MALTLSTCATRGIGPGLAYRTPHRVPKATGQTDKSQNSDLATHATVRPLWPHSPCASRSSPSQVCVTTTQVGWEAVCQLMQEYGFALLGEQP
eukprot:scaffold4808_cov215-Prasinococcus_capsulatus_cf.AAC.1